MAKKAKPWYWETRDGWYVKVQGQRYYLGEHPKDAPKPKKGKSGWNSPRVIDDALERLLKGEQPRSTAPAEDSVVAVLDGFVDWTKKNRAKLTASRYEEFIQDFVKATPTDGGVQFGAVPVTRLSSKHVTDWLAQREDWGPTTQRNAITARIRGFNWSVKNNGRARNPIAGMQKPEAKRRGEVVTDAEFEKILGAASGACIDLLTVSYDSGARPFEVKELETRHCQLDKQQAVIPATEAKGRKQTRVFYFPTDRSMEILRRLCGQYPEGPLFRNNLGNKWTGDAVKCGFARLDVVVGRRVTHYDFRRTFITRKIISGVDSHVVAKLSGHQSTAMIDRHYSAVANDHEFMLKMAKVDLPKKD